MDAQKLYHFIASVPGSFGDQIARLMAVEMIEAGRVDAGVALVNLAGLDVIPALAAAGVPAPMLRFAIEEAVMHRHRELPAFIARNGGRPALAAWCRQAEFAPPETLPESIDIYRGTLGCRPVDAVDGLHWSLNFDDAAWYAARFADTDLTGVHVVRASVHRKDIALFVSGTAHHEVIPAEAPNLFVTITDKTRIGDAAVRNALRLRGLKAQGWVEAETLGGAEGVARAARSRMAAAGLPRGTAFAAH